MLEIKTRKTKNGFTGYVSVSDVSTELDPRPRLVHCYNAQTHITSTTAEDARQDAQRLAEDIAENSTPSRTQIQNVDPLYAYALIGYPLAPALVRVVRVEPADRHTEAYCILSDDQRIPRSRVYLSKPAQVKKIDHYGEITAWEGISL